MTMPKIAEKTSQEWVAYFHHNAAHLLSIPWEHPYQLTFEERERVIPSIQQFELGENAEGKTFMRKATAYAQERDPGYIEAVQLFIKEEQRHSATLRKFLQGSKEPTLTKHWVDSTFRRLRKLLDIEIEVMVLLTAEMIAMVYYRCLKQATNSPILHTICEQILRDEAQHINFQSSALYKIRQTHFALRRLIMPVVHFTLLLGTIGVVWWYHGAVLKASNYPLSRFAIEVLLVFHKSYLVASGQI